MLNVFSQKKADGPTEPQQAAKRKPPSEIPDKPSEVDPITLVPFPSVVDIDTLKKKIDTQGQKVRELKAAGGSKVFCSNY